MKKLIFILILFPIFCSAQNITKRELRTLINKSIKVKKQKAIAYEDIRLIADNTDSVFFKSKEIKFFTSHQYRKNYKFCRTLQLDFNSSKFVSLQDCQSCKEPSSCYVVTEKTYFNYTILKEGEKIYLELNNRFEIQKFQVVNTLRDKEDRILEFNLIRL